MEKRLTIKGGPDRLRRGVWQGCLLAGLAVLLFVGLPALAAADEVRIGVLAKRGQEQALLMWNPTAVYLGEAIPDHSFTIVPLDFSEIQPALKKGALDFLLVNPAIYVEHEAMNHVSRIATMDNLRQGKGYTVFGGVILRRADRTDLKTAADLKGTRFMAVDPNSLGGWIMAWRELHDRGIEPAEDFKQLLFAGTHDQVVYAVRDGLADAGTVRTDTLERMAQEGAINLKDFAVLNLIPQNLRHEEALFPFLLSTRLYPEWPFAKVAHTPEALAKKVAIALLAMPADSAAARASRIVGWTIPHEYQEVHAAFRDLHIGPYADLGEVTLARVFHEYRYAAAGLAAFLFVAVLAALYFLRLNRRLRVSEMSMRSAHAELDRILNLAAAGFRIIDKDYTVVRVNQTLLDMMGLSAEEVLGTKCYETFPGAQCQTPNCPLQRVLAGEQRVECEVVKRDKAGREFPCILSGIPYLDEQGDLVGILEQFQDISAQKEIEQALEKNIEEAHELAGEVARKNVAIQEQKGALKKAYDDLKASQTAILQQEKMASIGQLAAGVAHEINNPMGFIASNFRTLEKYAEKLADYLNSQTETLEKAADAEALDALAAKRKKLKIDYILNDLKDLVHESLDGAERVKAIVANLKSFSRVDQEERKAADINECIETTLNIIWNELKYKVTVKKEYGDIPLTTCYPQQLNQVFMNLLVNASQAIQEKGTIMIKTWRKDDAVFVAIADNGRGIPQEKINRIFEPFFTTKEVGKGTGLGLSIVYDIIKKHHGEITVKSKVGKGTLFTISIPLVAES